MRLPAAPASYPRRPQRRASASAALACSSASRQVACHAQIGQVGLRRSSRAGSARAAGDDDGPFVEQASFLGRVPLGSAVTPLMMSAARDGSASS